MVKKVLKENYIYLIIIFGLIVLFKIISITSLKDIVLNIDYKVIGFINRIINNELTTFFESITFLGDFYIPVTIIVCIFFFIKNKWYFGIQSASYLLIGTITFISKYLVFRTRPLEALITIPSSYSFPSGHTTTSLVFYLVFCYLISFKTKKKIKICNYIFYTIIVLLIATSRIYLGVHFFSDVIGGILLGIPVLLMIYNVIDKNFKKKLKN